MEARSVALLRLLLTAALAALFVAAGAALAQESAVPAPAVPALASIEISGNTRTDETLIRRELGLVIGQPFSFDDMDEAWDHLEDTGYFAFVDMEYDDADSAGVVLRVQVEEDLTAEYGPLVRYDRRHKYLLGGRMKENNFRGRGETIEAALSVYYIQRAELGWKRPWLFGVSGLEGRFRGTGENANFVYRPTDYTKWDLGLELRWKFAGPVYLLGSADYGQFRQRDDFSWELPDRGEGSPTGSAFYAAGTSDHWVLTGGIGADTRDNPYYPRQGGLAELKGQRWLSDQFDSYAQASGDLRIFLPVPIKKHVLAARAWGRRTDGPTQLDNALYLGGPENIRGYRYASLEGDEGWLLSVEYRAPLFLMPISPKGELVGLGLHAFADAGDAWYYGADPHRPSQSFGGGVHINLDTLQLRFEAAKSRDGDWVFEFMDKFNF